MKFAPKPNKIIPWIQGVVQNEGAVRSAGNSEALATTLNRSFCMLFDIYCN